MLKGLWKGLKSLRAGKSEWDFDEHRDLVRVNCEYPVECRFGPDTHPGTVLDISLGGLRVQCDSRPLVGQSIEILYGGPDSEFAPVECEVQWVKVLGVERSIMGLRFSRGDEGLGDSWVSSLFKELGFTLEDLFQTRQFEKTSCVLDVTLEVGDDDSRPARLANLGARGAFLEAANAPQVDRALTLVVGPLDELEELRLGARVRNRREEKDRHFLGLEFEALDNKQASTLGEYLRHLATRAD